MFCSKCGKTIPEGSTLCPNCSNPVGDSPLTGSDITSAQSIVLPGDYDSNNTQPAQSSKYEPANNYTRTTYTSMSRRQQESGEIDSRTSYRPIYKGSVPGDVRDDMLADLQESRERVAKRDEDARVKLELEKAQIEKMLSEDGDILEEDESFENDAPEQNASETEENYTATADDQLTSEPSEEAPVEEKIVSEATQEKIDALNAELQSDNEEIDLSQFKARPISARGRVGLSQDVSDYLRQFEEDQRRKAKRDPNVSDTEDADDEEEQVIRSRKAMRAARMKVSAPVESTEEDLSDEDFEEEIKPVKHKAPVKNKTRRPTKSATKLKDLDDEDFDLDDDHSSAIGTIIKIVAAIVIVAALAFGVTRYIGYIRSNQSSAPIEGVTESLYDSAIALIKEHNSDSYKSSLLSQYNSGGVLSVSNTLTADSNAFKAMMPEEPAANDATFLQAILKIQDNIGSAILMDAMSDGSSTAKEDSNARWSVVDNSIATLEGITSAAELTGIINGETITVRNETPAPTATPIIYTPIQKGDENNDVLKLQTRLYALGYLEGDLDGAFGSKTQTAVKLFQQAAGLPESGIADSDTQNRLYADDAPYAPGATTPTPAPTSTPAPTEVPVEEPSAEEPVEQNAEDTLAA